MHNQAYCTLQARSEKPGGGRMTVLRLALLLALLAAPWWLAVQPAAAGDGALPISQEGGPPALPPELEQAVQATLTAVTASAGPGDSFGFSASLSSDGNTALIGAKTADVSASAGQGVAYIFTRSGITWSQQARLEAPDGHAGDEFGHSVALSDDGNTALVGAYKADVGSNTDAGKAYVFTRSGSTWTSAASLVPNTSQTEAYFGNAVAIDADGTTALVGAYKYDVGSDADQGAAFIFNHSNTGWSMGSTLGVGEASDYIGYSVALNNAGTLAALGAPGYDGGGDSSGRASFFEYTGVWLLKNHYAPADLLADDWFGRSIALDDDGNVAVVGASRADISGMAQHGAAYVLYPSGDSWMVSFKALGNGDAEDYLGVWVAVSGDGTVVLIGAYKADPGGMAQRGAAYSYTVLGGIWGSMLKLTFSEAAGDQFGVSVALDEDGNTRLAGASQANPYGSVNQGAAYVALFSGAGMVEMDRLTGSESKDAYVGDALAVSDDGNTVLVGAPEADDDGKMSMGAAYVFTYTASGWAQQARLAAPDGAAIDRFGGSVALSADGNLALVGAYNATIEGVSGAGAAYVFTRSGGTWTFLKKMQPDEPGSNGNYGFSVAVSDDGNTFLIGEPGSDVLSHANQGGAYLQSRSGATWYAPEFINIGWAYCTDGCFAGWSVALSGDGLTAVVGAPQADINGQADSGAAFVFVQDGALVKKQADLLPPTSQTKELFGRAVAISEAGSRVVIGAPGQPAVGSGAAYAFTRSGSTWTRVASLHAAQVQSGANFGESVALSGDGQAFLVGAPYEDIGALSRHGNVYPYAWRGAAPLGLPSLGAVAGSHARLGASLALSDNGSQAWLGAAGALMGGVEQGAAYTAVMSYMPRLYLPITVR